MKRTAILLSALAVAGGFTSAAEAQTTVRVAWCARTVSSAAAPFAIATKMGWFAKDGIKVELVPMPGSTDCVKAVATKDVQYGLPSIEPLAIIRPQGVKVKNYYTAYQANIYGIAVPDDSPIKTFADLKGKKIGVTSMASAGVIVARALASNNGFNPDKDILIVVEVTAPARHHGYRKISVQRADRAGGAAGEQPSRGGGAGARLCQGHGVRDRQSGGRNPHFVGGVPADQGDRQDRG